MDMYRRKFIFEITPIRVTDLPTGATKTQIADLNGRIVDVYSGMPVGMVLHLPSGQGAKFEAHTLFPARAGGDSQLPEPNGGWGRRFDLAADAVWHFYNRQLPFGARCSRFVWRWLNVFWFLAGATLSVAVNAAAKFLLN